MVVGGLWDLKRIDGARPATMRRVQARECAKIFVCARVDGRRGAVRPRGDARVVRVLPEAGVAQLVEQLIRNQQVRGSSPRVGSNVINKLT